MHLSVVGLNHKTASVEVREKVAFTTKNIERALATLSSIDSIDECLILSTCNRTEIYCVFKPGCYDSKVLPDFLANYNHLYRGEIEGYLYQLSNRQVVEHLFRVVSGLDSMVVGENQIASQAKQAYGMATTVKATGPILNKLFHIAFRVSKKIRTETRIGEGSLSVAQVACSLAERIFKLLSDRSVLLIGTGENGELIAKHLRKKGVRELIIINRTFKKADILAKKLEAKAVAFDNLEQILEKVDIVISSTASAGTVLRKEMLRPALAKRHLPLFMIDLAVPRDIEPAVGEMKNVYLYDMDSLQLLVDESRARRADEAHKAKQTIREEVEKLIEWRNSQKATPTIVEMQTHFERVRSAELEKVSCVLNEEQYKLVDAVTRSMMNKVLHVPIMSVRRAALKGDEENMIRTIRKVLGFKEES